VLWVDKYRPTSLSQLDLHEFITERLKKMIQSGDFPHVLFYGPSGAGKKTRIRALVKELFGAGAGKMKVHHRLVEVNPKSKKKVEITTMGSNYHVELNPADAGIYDRAVVQEVIKEMAETYSVHPGHQQRSFRVVVLSEVDRLSHGAQNALRRTMEKYMTTCRLILCCESASRVILPLRSRCLAIRVPAPTVEEIVGVLSHVASREKLKLPDELATRIAQDSGRNLRRAVLMLEACKADKYPFTSDQKVRVADWERFIDELGRIICEEQSPARLLLARNKMYELLGNCIPPDVIMRTLTNVLLKRVDDLLKHETVKWAAYYEHRLKTGSKPIFHMEAFVAKFMAIYKRWILESFG